MNFSISAEKPRPSLVMLLLRLFPPWLKQLLLVLALAGLYLITARLGLALAQPPAEKATVVWLPSGIALAAVLLVGYRIWPGIWLGAFLANLWDFFEPANQFSLAAHLMPSGGIALGSTLQTLLRAYLLRRWNGWQTILERSQSVFRFIGVGLLMSLVASSCGVTILYLAGFITLADYPLNWWTWWLGDTVGVLMVTPLLLAWRKPPRVVREPRRLVEAGLLLAALPSVGLGAFGGWSPRGIDAGFLVYMTIPLLVWAALRFGLRGATAALLLTLGIGVWGAAQSHGPFVGETLNESLLLLQIFMSILTVTALTLVGALQGTTSQKIAEQQVATVLAQLEAVLENVDAGLLLIGEDNATIRWANQSFCDFFDIPDMEPIKDDSKLTQALHQYIEANAVVDGPADELRALMHQDPNYCGPAGQLELVHPVMRLLQRSAASVHNEQGQYIGRLWIYRDITEQHRLKEQVVCYQKVDSIGRLAAGTAHEFNNVLGAIMGFNSMALEKAPPATEVAGYLQEVNKAVSRASDLVQQLLSFSRVQPFKPKALDLNDLILESGRMLRRLLPADVELVDVLAPDLGLLKADPGQLTQVLVNLTVNARDAMPQGGKLVISTSNAGISEEEAARIGVSSAGRYVVLTVSDTGTGMTQRVKAHLFEPFFTTKEVGKGTGLGLSTCYGIVKQSGGHIEVFSEPGKGATFKIYLPATEEAAEAVTIESDDKLQANDRPRGWGTVLLAEDDPLVREFVCNMLRAQGYTVLEASDGGEALALVEKNAGEEIHLLVADLVMPLMGGKELAERVRATYPEIKALFISGCCQYSAKGDDTLDVGVDFLAKPFRPDAL